jgi:hypothetical protein
MPRWCCPIPTGLLRRHRLEVGTCALLYPAAIVDGVATNFVMTIPADIRHFDNGSVNLWLRPKIRTTLRICRRPSWEPRRSSRSRPPTLSYHDATAAFQRELLRQALTQGNHTAAAQALGLQRTYFHRWRNSLGLREAHLDIPCIRKDTGPRGDAPGAPRLPAGCRTRRVCAPSHSRRAAAAAGMALAIVQHSATA